MKFPTNIAIPVASQNEFDLVIAAIGLINDGSDKRLMSICSGIKCIDGSGRLSECPDAVVEVDGKKVGSGSLDDMKQLFKSEITSHSGNVILKSFRGAEGYKMLQKRSARR